MQSLTRHQDDFKKLNSVREYLNTTVKEYCKTAYGKGFYQTYVMNHLNDLLENLEFYVEDLAEKTIHEEELNYDGNNRGLADGTE